MPTYEADREFLRDWRRLTPEQQHRFKTAVRRFVEDLKAGRPPRRGLGIERFQGHEGVFEFHWRLTVGHYSRTAHLLIPTMSMSFGCALAHTTSTAHSRLDRSRPLHRHVRALGEGAGSASHAHREHLPAVRSYATLCGENKSS
jgi:hypothetical protein